MCALCQFETRCDVVTRPRAFVLPARASGVAPRALPNDCSGISTASRGRRGVRRRPAARRHGGARAVARHRSGAGARALHVRADAPPLQHARGTATIGRRRAGGDAPGAAARACAACRRSITRPAENVPGPAQRRLLEPTRSSGARMTPRELIPAIIADRSASLICLGLSSLDDATLDYLGDHPSHPRACLRALGHRLRRLLRQPGDREQPRRPAWRPAAGAAGTRRDEAVALWEAVVGEKVTRPDRFIAQLFELNEGRLVVSLRHHRPARSAAPRVRARPVDHQRADARRTLQGAGRRDVDAFREAHLRTLPFGRASYDLSMTLHAPRGRRQRRPAPAGVARLLVARLQRPRPAGRWRRGRCETWKRSRSTPRGWSKRSAPPMFGCAPSGSIRLRSASACSAKTAGGRARRRPGGAARAVALPDAGVDARAHGHDDAGASTRTRRGTSSASARSKGAAASTCRRSFRDRWRCSRG